MSSYEKEGTRYTVGVCSDVTASKQVADARVFAGIHYRTACDVGRTTGEAVATYIAEKAFNPLNGKKKSQTAHNHGTGRCDGDGEASGNE